MADALNSDIVAAINDQTRFLQSPDVKQKTAFASSDIFLAVAGAIGALDVMGPVGVFPGIGPESGGEVMITSAQLMVEHTAVTSGETSYLLYLYNRPPPSALADNAVFDITTADRGAFVCQINLGTPVDLGSTLLVETDGINKQVTVPKGGALWAYLVTVGTFTATAQFRKVTLHSTAL